MSDRRPPILAFQSIADATVSPLAVLDALFTRLAPGAHHRVLFDVNRYADVAMLLTPAALAVHRSLLDGPGLSFGLRCSWYPGPESNRHDLAV